MPVDIITTFLDTGPKNGYWTVEQFVSWAQNLRVGSTGLQRGQGNKFIKKLKEALQDKTRTDLNSTRKVVSKILSPEAVEPALNRNLEWLHENLKNDKVEKLKYHMKVHRQFGIDGLMKEPKITIGTIHSVKGGEADVVYLFPDISYQAADAITNDKGTEHVDSVRRLFYVGMTRAYEELVLMAPAAKTGALFVEM
jgi:superfamily I DNA/RNA helicase